MHGLVVPDVSNFELLPARTDNDEGRPESRMGAPWGLLSIRTISFEFLG